MARAKDSHSDDVSRPEHRVLACSFCGKGKNEVAQLVAGPAVYICNECIGLCKDIIAVEADLEGAEALTLRGPQWAMLGIAEAHDALKAGAPTASVRMIHALLRHLTRLHGSVRESLGDQLALCAQRGWIAEGDWREGAQALDQRLAEMESIPREEAEALMKVAVEALRAAFTA